MPPLEVFFEFVDGRYSPSANVGQSTLDPFESLGLVDAGNVLVDVEVGVRPPALSTHLI